MRAAERGLLEWWVVGRSRRRNRYRSLDLHSQDVSPGERSPAEERGRSEWHWRTLRSGMRSVMPAQVVAEA